MANTLQIKRHSSNTTTTAPGSLGDGELALNQAAKQLFVGRHNNSSVEVFHLPTLQDLTYGNGISGTVASGSNDNSSTLAVDLTDSNIFATTSAKGIASFATADFAVSSGAVSIASIGTSQIDADAITGAKIADDAIDSEHYTNGSIDLAHMSANSIDSTQYVDGSIDVAHMSADSIDSAQYVDGSIDLAHMSANSVDSSQYVDGSIDTAHIANDAITAALIVDNIALAGNCSSVGNFTVGGNLIVDGTTSTVNSTVVTIDDPIFTLGGDTAPGSDDGKDRGIEFRYHNGSAAKVGYFGWDDSAEKFTFIADATNSSEVFSGTAGPVQFGAINGTTCTLTGALSGATIDGGTY